MPDRSPWEIPAEGARRDAAQRLYVALGWAERGTLYDIAALGTVRAPSRAAALVIAAALWPERARLGGGTLRVRAASTCRRTYLLAALAADALPHRR